ncbi:hypothetical protein RRG08_038356 [Elysia crispata]|uniref:Uncharacterized protein n=1 Tax=Elysia crispata TaxID=231223 RepID=A0AAE1DX27_9GAST|nr:hypothetical protein RRG08_038356 [Elysia crispata]
MSINLAKEYEIYFLKSQSLQKLKYRNALIILRRSTKSRTRTYLVNSQCRYIIIATDHPPVSTSVLTKR